MSGSLNAGTSRAGPLCASRSLHHGHLTRRRQGMAKIEHSKLWPFTPEHKKEPSGTPHFFTLFEKNDRSQLLKAQVSSQKGSKKPSFCTEANCHVSPKSPRLPSSLCLISKSFFEWGGSCKYVQISENSNKTTCYRYLYIYMYICKQL